jgi:methionyl-tRNA formyltransferase
VMGVHKDRIYVACGVGILGIQRLQAAGRRVVSASEFAHAHTLDGARFT